MNLSALLATFVGFQLYSMVICDFTVLKPPTCEEYSRQYLSTFAFNVSHSKLNLDMDLSKSLVPGLRVNMDFLSRKYNSKPYRSFYQYSMDICSMLNNQKINIFKRWFLTFFSYGNFKKNCPVPPGHYYIRNFNINKLVVPPFLYAGFYRIIFNMTQIDDFIMYCLVEVEIK